MITSENVQKRRDFTESRKKPSKRREYQEGCEIVLSKYSQKLPCLPTEREYDVCKKKFKPENYFIGNLINCDLIFGLEVGYLLKNYFLFQKIVEDCMIFRYPHYVYSYVRVVTGSYTVHTKTDPSSLACMTPLLSIVRYTL